MAARTRQASEIGQQRSSARAISLAAGGAARTAFRPGAEDLRAGFGQATVEDVANYSALIFTASGGLYERDTQCSRAGVCQFPASEDALAHGVAADRGAGPMGDARRALLGGSRAAA